MFSYVSLERRVPQDHPLRAIRKLTDEVLRSMSGEFDALYSDMGRRSIAPEYVLRALLLQVLFSVRSERQLVEQIDYNLLFRWFVGLGMDDGMWNHAVFSKNRDRLLNSEMAQRFFAEVNQRAKPYMSDDHFTVDGTLIRPGLSGDFGTFEALEFLALGIQGKLSLWHALQVVAVLDSRLRGLDFNALIAKAEAQYTKVEERRLALASTALSPTTLTTEF